MHLYLEIGAEGGKNDAMTGELLPSAAQRNIAESIVKPQAVQAFQHLVGMPRLDEHIVFTVHRPEWWTRFLQTWRRGQRGQGRGAS